VVEACDLGSLISRAFVAGAAFKYPLVVWRPSAEELPARLPPRTRGVPFVPIFFEFWHSMPPADHHLLCLGAKSLPAAVATTNDGRMVDDSNGSPTEASLTILSTTTTAAAVVAAKRNSPLLEEQLRQAALTTEKKQARWEDEAARWENQAKRLRDTSSSVWRRKPNVCEWILTKQNGCVKSCNLTRSASRCPNSFHLAVRAQRLGQVLHDNTPVSLVNVDLKILLPSSESCAVLDQRKIRELLAPVLRFTFGRGQP
jgi:hypothetical protein